MIIYNLVLLLAVPVIAPFLLWRRLTGKETGGSLRQKFGRYPFPPPQKGAVWVHAVSVGETNAAIPLVEELGRGGKRPVALSVSTQTGMGLAQNRIGGKTPLFFFPFDFPFAVRRALDFHQPAAVVFMETELWPNFMAAAKQSGVKTILVNGRISDRSFGAYRLLRPLFSTALKRFDLLLMQTEEDRRRIIDLGANPQSVQISGNLKFDRPLPDISEKSAVRREFGIAPDAETVIFASTHPGEDEIFLSVCASLIGTRPNLFPVIVPRHIERAPKIAQLCRDRGFSPRLRTGGGEGNLLVLDTIGELARLYGAGNLAVMGGSFIPHGGQNPIEAAGWELPVLFGPHMENFREISAVLAGCGGAFNVGDAAGLGENLLRLLSGPAGCAAAGKAGRAAIARNGGALNKTTQAIKDLLQ